MVERLLGIAWRDKVTNEEVRKRTGQILLEKVIRERRMQWLGHVTMMDEERISKQALRWEVAGFRRRPGRPRMNYRDVVKKGLQRMGLTREEVEASAQDRHSWRQRVALYASVMLEGSRKDQGSRHSDTVLETPRSVRLYVQQLHRWHVQWTEYKTFSYS